MSRPIRTFNLFHYNRHVPASSILRDIGDIIGISVLGLLVYIAILLVML